MAAAPYGAPEPAEKPLTILAALGPRMLALSASHADGAHPYNVTPEHTARGAAASWAPASCSAPRSGCCSKPMPAKARAFGRQALANYMRLDNYVNNWRRLGFGDDDFAGGGSDRFIDANVAWGDEETIRARLQEHWDAGADHVCIQSISPDGSRQPDEKVLALLAPG